VSGTTIASTAEVPRPTTDDLERHRRELTAHCYRMLGSGADAEDAVQETFVRAWRSIDRFEGRSTVRTWLYRIATNVCLDQLAGRRRRARPFDLGPASTVATAQLVTRPEEAWLEPIPDAWALPTDADPAEVAVARETIRLAFVAALQHLPPRQRAVLLLREVLQFPAAQVADLLDTSVASVNSALQRARATMADRVPEDREPLQPTDARQQELLSRFVDAFERYDMDALTALLHEDVVQTMPPYELWLRGRDEIAGWMLGPGAGCRGSRLVPTAANGAPAFGQYRPAATGRGHDPWALQVVEVTDGRIVGLNAFLATERLFPAFGLPPHLPAT
jgi:RNA polymerase sigma-70 factor, ECF subfamily